MTDIHEAAVACMKCGFCKASCPVHLSLGTETTSPRARVRLARAFTEGDIDLSDALKTEISHCINCKACTAECPSGVEVDRIVLEMRRQVVEREGLHPLKRLIFRSLLPYPSRLGRLLRGMGRMTQIAGLANPKNPLRAAFPLLGLPRDKRLPPLMGERSFRSMVPEVAEPLAEERMTAAYFVGCSGDFLYPQVAMSTWRVLRKLGCRVIVPRGMVCCGTPVLNAGDFDGARQLALRNIEVLSNVRADVIVTACGSCGLTISREWREVLGLDVPNALAKKIVDISPLTLDLIGGAAKLPFESTVTYHDSCHLRIGMGVHAEPREILKSISGINYVEMESADRCCGGGGAYSIYHPRVSRDIGAAKAASIEATGADTVVTGCPACMMQLEECLSIAGSSAKVLHTSQVIDRILGDHT